MTIQATVSADSAAMLRAPLGFIGAAANSETERHDDSSGQARAAGEGRGDHPGQVGPFGDAESAPLYMPSGGVRAVRRATRSAPGGKEYDVVEVDFVATDETIDSHRSIVVCDHDLRRFDKNPVLLWAHNRDKDHPPIGRCENLKITRDATGCEMTATAVFFTRTDFQREIADAYALGECRMFSIGFIPSKFELLDVNGEEILVLSGNTLVEISAVPVGSNENALAKKAFDAARAIARREAPGTTPPADLTLRAPAGAPKEHTMKTITLDVRAHRAANGTTAACPACNEAMGVQFTNLPEDRGAELEQVRASLTEQTALVAAEQKRATGLEARLAETSTRLATMLLDGAIREIDARIGKKIEPTERDEEIELARTYLADTTPDLESLNADKVPTRTLGQKKLAARLAKIDGRRDLGLLGPAITSGEKLPEPDAKVRSVTEPTPPAMQIGAGGITRGGDAAASLLDAPATA